MLNEGVPPGAADMRRRNDVSVSIVRAAGVRAPLWSDVRGMPYDRASPQRLWRRVLARPLAADVFPIALKVNLQYSSEPDPNGLPKAIVDEVELLASGPVTPHVSYRLEQYMVDGGEPGLTRDAWLEFLSRPAFGDTGSALRVTAGQFTLPLPVDPETQRETINHYQIFDQKVGDDPFDCFNDGMGIDIAYGRETDGTVVHLMALK